MLKSVEGCLQNSAGRMGRYLNRSEYAEKRNALLLEMQIKLEKVDGDGKVLRIAALVEYFPPNMGSDRRIFEIMKRLALKHEIHFVILPPIRMLVEGAEENVRPFHGDKIVFKKFEGIFGHFVQIPQRICIVWLRSKIIGYILTHLYISLKILILLKRLNPKVVVLNYPSPYTGLIGFLGAKTFGKVVVTDFNDLIAQYTIDVLDVPKKSLKAKMLIFIQHFLVKHSDKVVAPTKFIKRYAVSLGVPEEKIVLIPNGVDTKTFKPMKSCIREKLCSHMDHFKICVYCGRLDNWAGAKIIEDLSRIAKGRNLNVKFLLAGDGAAKPSLEDNIIFLGKVEYENIPFILAGADVVLVPFPNNEVSHAASPLKLFEAMAMQKPVVASKVCGINEVISDGENGLLASPDDVNEWVEKLELILKSKKLCAKIAKNARKTAERFDWRLIANKFENVLVSLNGNG